MRLAEFSSAQDQLALWKLISDTVWSSINAQAKQQAQVAAQQKRIVKPKTKVASKVKIPRPPAPKPLPQPKPLYQAKAKPIKPAPTKVDPASKRLPSQLTAKPPNPSTAKMDTGVVPRGIATMNALANPAITENK
ncbi:MAG: hypothetical protein RLZ25_1222 [Pseudomonadota bacterium]